MPDVPEPTAQHPRLAEQLRRAFGARVPTDPQFQRLIELLERDYADTGAPGAPDVGAADCSGGFLWRVRNGPEGFRHGWCRGQLLRRMGLFGEEMEGRSLADFWPPSAVARLVPHYHRAWSGEAHAAEIELPEIGLRLTMQFQPVFLGGVVHEVIVTGVESAGHAAQGGPLLESVLQHTCDGVIVTDANLEEPGPTIVYVNRAFTALSGYGADELLGRNPRLLQGGQSENEELARLRAALQSGQAFNGRLVNLRKDGATMHVDCSISPLRDATGRITHWIGVQRDVSEEQRVASALQESEARYRSVIDSIREVVFQTDLFGRWTFLNPAWEAITGFPVHDTLGTALFNYIHPEDRLRNDALLRPVADHSPGFARYEFRCLTRGGGFRWVEVFARLNLAGAGEPVGLSGTLSDITDRKESEQRLRESEERFRVMFVTSPIGMVLTELDGTIVDANQAFMSILGYRAMEMSHLSLWQITPPEYFAAEQEQLRRIHETGRYGPYEKEVFHRSGARVPVLLNGMLVRGPEGRRQLWSFVEDITERKQAERALGESEQRFRDVSDAVGEFIWEIAADGTIAFVTDRVSQVLGIEPGELVGRPAAELVPGLDQAEWERHLREALATGERFSAMELRGSRRDGQLVWLSLSGVPVRGEKGIVLCLRGAGRDITRRKESQSALRAAEERISLLVESSADAFWDVDFETSQAFFAPRLADMLGCQMKELTSHPAAFFELIHPDDRAVRDTPVPRRRDRPFAWKCGCGGRTANGSGWRSTESTCAIGRADRREPSAS